MKVSYWWNFFYVLFEIYWSFEKIENEIDEAVYLLVKEFFFIFIEI